METMMKAIDDRMETLAARVDAHRAALDHLAKYSHYKTPSARLDINTLPHKARLSIRKLSYSDNKELAIYVWWKGRHDVWAQMTIADPTNWHSECSARLRANMDRDTAELGQLELLKVALPDAIKAHDRLVLCLQEQREAFPFSVPEIVARGLPLLFGTKLRISRDITAEY